MLFITNIPWLHSGKHLNCNVPYVYIGLIFIPVGCMYRAYESRVTIFTDVRVM